MENHLFMNKRFEDMFDTQNIFEQIFDARNMSDKYWKSI